MRKYKGISRLIGKLIAIKLCKNLLFYLYNVFIFWSGALALLYYSTQVLWSYHTYSLILYPNTTSCNSIPKLLSNIFSHLIKKSFETLFQTFKSQKLAPASYQVKHFFISVVFPMRKFIAHINWLVTSWLIR